MANNCLVTKLKSVVQNNNLLELGEMMLSNPSLTGNYQYYFERVGDAKIRLVEGTGTYKINEGTEAALQNITTIDGSTANNFKIILNPGAKCAVNCKYNNTCKQVDEIFEVSNTFNAFDDKYKYLSALTRVKYYGYGNCNVIDSNILIQLILGGKDITGIEDLIRKNKNSLTRVNITPIDYMLKNCTTQFNLNVLAECTSLATIHTVGATAHGTIESFVAALVANGVTSGSREFQNANYLYNVTYQDVDLRTLSNSHTYLVLSWTGVNDITLTWG